MIDFPGKMIIDEKIAKLEAIADLLELALMTADGERELIIRNQISATRNEIAAKEITKAALINSKVDQSGNYHFKV